MSHRMVCCPGCELVYVDTPPRQDELAHAYHQAEYDSSEEADDAARAYIYAIGSTLAKLKSRGSVLEIGTGTGVFLEHLKRAGFQTLVGVEPSRAAIVAAPEHRQAWIRESIFVESEFEPASFDLICCFMTMEHVLDPGQLADSAMRLLRPGGAFVTVTHDYRSRVNRILGRRSPIIDVEHLQLFSSASAKRLFESRGFEDVQVQAFVNSYALGYWLRLLPLPSALKSIVQRMAAATGLTRMKLGFNVGNIITAGFRRA